ncbi:activating transcription factor 7-interacting protein 1 isoform X3 [Sminthopsis crassicaudata]|uniref:activating transcription factor 7-interacting protein 1 isoform X3 n=1 Tax=Sminthopsis crassicaudata TaxID=9301 RepID=UPI003D69DAC0
MVQVSSPSPWPFSALLLLQNGPSTMPRRFKMESTEEPQKKIFKARKTMRVSDRQQLEVVYKVKEELLKTDVKLLNGKHENGDSDLNSPLDSTDCIDDKEVNGIEDVCLDLEEKKSELKEPSPNFLNIDVREEDEDSSQKCETASPKNTVYEPEQDTVPETENTVPNSNKEDGDILEKNSTDDENLDQREKESPLEDKTIVSDNIEIEEEKLESNTVPVSADLPTEDEKNMEENPVTESAFEEEAISSSMEIDKDTKSEDDKSPDLPETTEENVENEKNEKILDNTDSMETDEIIPILEKLAPAEDELSFSKTSLIPLEETSPDLGEKLENSLGSPSKQESSSESLPKEAFLVLSDEEEASGEKDVEIVLPVESSSPVETETKEKDSKLGEEKEAHKEEERPGKNELLSRRKRSKSEDMDNVQSKRRRYLGEEYEAELQVKITARGDINQKLQKVVQRLLEEKLSALQCAVFDKTLADLKMRVEKIECNKRHKTVLTELQAKIARLTKRFGAAKEDLKKRQENPPNPPVSPGKSSANEVVSINNLTYRNAGTVRQMLESKRNIGESTPPFQAPVNAVSSASLATPQTMVGGQPKSQTPVTSGSLTASVLPAPTTAPVVASTQVSSGNSQPTISLQSLPVILHVPVAVSSQPQLLQGHTGTLVTNQQPGNVEFISVQSQSTVSGLTKNPTPLPSTNPTKPNNSSSVTSPSIQRNSPASAAPLGTTLAVQAVSAAHPIAQATRTSLPAVGTSGLFNPANNRSIQMKIPLAAFGTTSTAEPSSTTVPPRIENQTNKTTDASINKRAAENTPQSGKATSSDSGGVIDLTLDDEEVGTSQDPKKPNHTSVSSAVSQPTQPLPRPLQPLQPAPLQQTGVPTSGPSQTTIHLLPTAPTTVNVTHRPVTQATTRLPIPRVPTNHQVVYTTLPAPPAQAPVRGAVLQNSTVPIRQVNPPNGVTVRVPQAATYVVNNGLTLGSTGPQLTVHHRPPQVHPEPSRPLHPAPLPEAPQPQRLPPEAASTSLPQKPHLKLARVQSQNGIVLSWSVLEVDRSCASVDSYHLYAYHEDPSATMPSQWKKIGEVKALPLPMACTLTQFVSGSKYYFAVRAKDIYGRFGPFCDPQSTDVISSQSS